MIKVVLERAGSDPPASYESRLPIKAVDAKRRFLVGIGMLPELQRLDRWQIQTAAGETLDDDFLLGDGLFKMVPAG